MPRVKTHFKVHASIQNHRKMPGVYADDALLAMYVRAGMLAVERYASRTSDSFLLSAGDLCQIAQTQPIPNALRKLARLAREPSGDGAGSPLRVSRSGAWYRLDFPNLKSKQGFGVKNGGRRENPSDSDSDSDSDSTKRTRAKPRGTAPERVREPVKRTSPKDLLDAYALAREEIARLKPSGLPEVPSKSALRDLRKLLDRYPGEERETVIRETIRGAWAYWISVNPDAEEKTRRARLVLSTLCTERGSDKYREHGRIPAPMKREPKPDPRPQPPPPTAAEKARSDRFGRLSMAVFRAGQRKSKKARDAMLTRVEAAFENGDEDAILELEGEFLASTDEECPV